MKQLRTNRLTGLAYESLRTATAVVVMSALAHEAHAQQPVFHKGDKILASPYSGVWQLCTLTTDRQGTPRYYNYTAMCEAVDKTSNPNLQQRNFTEDRVKALTDPAASAQFAAQNAAQGVAPKAAPQQAPPQAAAPAAGQAATPAQYKAGDRVAMPSGSGKWLDAVILSINADKAPFPYRVHPLGYTPYMDAQFSAQQLRPQGAVMTQPVGGIVDDPYLLAAQGKQAFRPTQVYPGVYECFTRTNGQLVSAAILNFTIVDRTTYRSVSGGGGQYHFDAATGAVTFRGGGLTGQRATYAQASNPPVRSQPPEVRLGASGDYCQLKMY